MDIATTKLHCIDARGAAPAVVSPDDLHMGRPDGPRGRLSVDRSPREPAIDRIHHIFTYTCPRQVSTADRLLKEME